MKVGIMQPYFLPYIGYWQLMNYVDKYVIFDDANYIDRGWVNRNRIIINNEVQYINLPLLKKSSNKLINEININRTEINKLLKKVESGYSKAPYYKMVMPIFEEIIKTKDENLASFLKQSIKIVARYLEIDTEFIVSSTIDKNNTLKCQDKVLDICRILNATEYINAIGGQELYSKEKFKENNINLLFLKTNNIEYKQLSNRFEPNLSILDMMMNCSKEKIKAFLNDYTLL